MHGHQKCPLFFLILDILNTMVIYTIYILLKLFQKNILWVYILVTWGSCPNEFQNQAGTPTFFKKIGLKVDFKKNEGLATKLNPDHI